MGITIGQIQNLLSVYHKQQVESRLAEARIRSSREGASGQEEDRVIISAEAKRLQIYQKTAEEVLRRLKEDTWSPLVEEENHEGEDEPSGILSKP